MSNRLNRTINGPLTLRIEGSFGARAPPVDIFEGQNHVDSRDENGVITRRVLAVAREVTSGPAQYRSTRTKGVST